MSNFCLRHTICFGLLGLLLAGCATNQNQFEPSLWSKLKYGSPDIRQANYEVDANLQLASKKIEDPLPLKLRYARWMEELENYPEARSQYGTILADEPDNFDAVLGLARIDQAVGQNQQAEAGFRRALKLRPDSAIAQHGVGQFELAQGHIAQALPLLSQALQVEPNNQAYRYHLAVALAKSGDINAALPHFQKTVGQAAAHHNIATILRDAGDIRGAEQQFRQALSIQPDLEESRHALAALYDRQPAQQYAAPTRGGSVIQGAPNQSVVPAGHRTR